MVAEGPGGAEQSCVQSGAARGRGHDAGKCTEKPLFHGVSYSLKVGDIVSVREKSKSLEVIVGSLAGGSKSRYAWLEWDGAAMAGKFLQRPEREEIPENIKEQLIVELYSK